MLWNSRHARLASTYYQSYRDLTRFKFMVELIVSVLNRVNEVSAVLRMPNTLTSCISMKERQ